MSVGGITKFLERKLIKLLYDHGGEIEGRFNRLDMDRLFVDGSIEKLFPIDGMGFARQNAKCEIET